MERFGDGIVDASRLDAVIVALAVTGLFVLGPVGPIRAATPSAGSVGEAHPEVGWSGASLTSRPLFDPSSVTTSGSIDQGETFLPSQEPVPRVDRQCNASVGSSRVYLTSRHLGALVSGTSSLVALQSDEGGLTYPRGAFITTLTRAPTERLQGNLVAYPEPGNDPPQSTLHNVFAGRGRRDLYLATCPSPCDLPPLIAGTVDPSGKPFQTRRIFQAPPGSSVDNVFPVVAVDRAGGIHVAFSDKKSVFLLSSPDGGTTWLDPVPVNNPGDPSVRTSLFPWIAAGDAGRVGVKWYGTEFSLRLGNGYEASAPLAAGNLRVR